MNYLNHHEFGIDHKPWNQPTEYNDINIKNKCHEQCSIFY